MKILQKIWFWFVMSSKDSAKFSLTLKAAGGYAIVVLASLGLNIEGLEGLWGLTVDTAFNVLQVVLAVIALYGSWRKFLLTWKGQNQVLKDPVFME